MAFFSSTSSRFASAPATTSSCLRTECPCRGRVPESTGDVVEEVAIVRHGDDRARVLVQMPLQPGDALGVEVVRRLVEQQQVGLFEQHLAQRHAAPLAAGELRDVGVARRQVHRVHRDFDLPVELPGVARLDLVLHLACSVEQLFHLVGVDRPRRACRDLVVLGAAARASARPLPRRCRTRPCRD